MHLRSLLVKTTLLAVLCGPVLVACGNDDDSAAEPAGSLASADSTIAMASETTAVAGDTTEAASETTVADAGDSGSKYALVADADVAKGLPEVVRLAASSAAKVEAGAAQDAGVTLDEAYAEWLKVEGTVKVRDQDAYLDIEDALTLITIAQEQNDGAKARQGAADVDKVVAAYLARFPGDGSEPPLPSVATKPAEHKVDVTLSDYEITMPTPVPAGVVEFELENKGTQTHEFLVLKTDLAPEQLPKDAEGDVDERGPGVTLVDEKEGIEGGSKAELTVELAPGKYVFLCNVTGHYAQKMYLAVTVA